MEKITVKEILETKSGDRKDGKGKWTMIKFKTETDEEYETFDTLEVGQTYEGTIEKQTNPAWTDKFKLPKKGKGFGGPRVNYNFEARKTALECATRLRAAGILTGENFTETRDYFEKYLKEVL